MLEPKRLRYELQGSWKDEDKAALVALVEVRGRKWKDIGAELNRLPGACKDCYKELAVGGERRGKWSKDEEAALESAVNEFLTTREVRALSCNVWRIDQARC